MKVRCNAQIDEWVGRRMDAWMDGWKDERMDGQMDGQTDYPSFVPSTAWTMPFGHERPTLRVNVNSLS